MMRQDPGEPRAVDRFARNFGSLTASRVAGDVLTFLLFIVLSRTFGQEGVGQYSFAMGLTGVFAAIADFGLYNLTVKELSRHLDSRQQFLGSVLALRLVLSLGAFALLLVLLPFLPLTSQGKLVVAIIGGFQVLATLANGFAAALVAQESMAVAGLLDAMGRAVGALAAAVLVLAGSDLVVALLALPAAALAQTVTAAALVAGRHGWTRPPRGQAGWVAMVRAAVPYGLSVLIRRLAIRLDVILLAFLIGTAAVGVYSAAYRVIFVFMFLPTLASLAVFPRVSRAYSSMAHDELTRLYHRSLRFAVLSGLPSVVGIWLIAPALVAWLFGEAFSDSVWLLRLLAPLLLLECLRSLIAVFLTGCDRQAARTRREWLAAGVTLAGNLVLISTVGTIGAAIATVTAELVLVVLMAAHLAPLLGWPRIGSRLAMGGTACAAFWVPLTFLMPLPLAAAVPTAMALYLIALLSFKEIRRNEARALMQGLAR
jgi:O-antigen/teichoic acid export membrane protein